MSNQLPTLAVLGGGNSQTDGPSYDNVHNAELVAQLINEGRADPNLVMALGRGPEDVFYPVTEARFMQAEISSRLVTARPEFVLDELSTSTATNILRLSDILVEHEDIERLGIVCLPWQDARVRDMATMALGVDFDIEVFASNAPRSKPGIAKEVALRGIFRASCSGLEPGVTADYITAVKRYNAVVSKSKGAAVAVADSGLVPGLSRGSGRYRRK